MERESSNSLCVSSDCICTSSFADYSGAMLLTTSGSPDRRYINIGSLYLYMYVEYIILDQDKKESPRIQDCHHNTVFPIESFTWSEKHIQVR